MFIKQRLLSLAYGIISLTPDWLISVYTVGCPPLEVYDFSPRDTIPMMASDFWSTKWTFPDDYHLGKTPKGRDIAIVTDDKGESKLALYTGNVIHFDTDWTITVTVEGSIVYHSPNCSDPRTEATILVPYGWQLDGLLIGEDITVIQSFTLDPAWASDAGFMDRQYFTYVPVSGDEEMLTQEVTWDTDSLTPVVKTKYHHSGFSIYTTKLYAALWHSWGDVVDNIEDFAPVIKFTGYNRTVALNIGARNLDFILDKYAVETEKFDKFRNPDLVP